VAWTIEYDLAARKHIEKLDSQTRRRLRNFLEVRIAALENPRLSGQALQRSQLGQFWQYRVGDYRIICDLQGQRLVVLVIETGRRSEIYR
jgi:mRNA interferase RelE/StbE